MSVVDIAALMAEVEKPGRYVGGELNQIVKAEAAVRFALCFADVYEVAMSHTGLRILYECINRVPEYAAERCYAPWPDLERALRRADVPLWSLETRRPLGEFDLVGFSLQYELSYPTLLGMLDLGKIPVRAKDRTAAHPLIVAGGSGAFNPEPMAEFIDGFLIGEGEEAVLELCALGARIRAARAALSGLLPRDAALLTRNGQLAALAEIPGMYVPALVDVDFEPGGAMRAIRMKDRASTPGQIPHRVIPDLEAAPFPSKPLVANVAIVHDRVGVEVQRGCTKSCRFCQAGMIFRPTRQRNPETVLKIVEDSLAATGQDEVGFLSLSIGDYEPLQPLLETFFDKYRDAQVGVSLPSLRTETLTQDVVTEIARGKKHSFTLAPEAGSDRMRRIINKGNTEANLLRAVETAVNAGWTVLKYYFMIGLPFETQDDVDAIAHLAIKSRAYARQLGKRLDVTVSVSSFVPKPHTPFQWEPQIDEGTIRRQQDRLKAMLAKEGIQFRYHNAGQTLVEGVISRGDRRVGDVIYAAYALGCRLDAWDDYFDLEKWRAAFGALEKHGLDWQWYHRRRDLAEPLAWDLIDAGVSKRFLLKDLGRAHKEAEIEDCGWGKCQACSACDFKEIEPITYPRAALSVPPPPAPRPRPEGSRRFRVRFAKDGVALYLSHLEFMHQLLRAFRRADIDLVLTQGFKPHPKLSFSPALPMAMASDAEFFDAELHGAPSEAEFFAELERSAPPGMRICDVRVLDPREAGIGNALAAMTFAAPVPGALAGAVLAAVERYKQAAQMPLCREKNGLVRVFELKQEIAHLTLAPSSAGFAIHLTLRQRLDGTVRPDEAGRALFGDVALSWRKIDVDFGAPQVSSAVVSGERVRPRRGKKNGGGRGRDQVQRERQRGEREVDVLTHAPFRD